MQHHIEQIVDFIGILDHVWGVYGSHASTTGPNYFVPTHHNASNFQENLKRVETKKVQGTVQQLL